MKHLRPYFYKTQSQDYGPLFNGEVLRDEALTKVAEHNQSWTERCIKEFLLCEWGSFTGEDLRFHLTASCGYPNHSNAWGSLVSTLVKRKIIKPTGEYRPMKDENSHARRTPVYTK